MLQFIRSKSGGIFVKLILLVLVLSFALFGVSDMFRSDDSSKTVASMDGFKVTQGQLDQEMYRQAQMFSQMFGQDFSAEKLKAMGFERSFLQKRLDDAAISKFAEDFKLGVGESQIRDAILKKQEFKGENGQFDAVRFKTLVERGLLNEASLIHDIKRGIAQEAVTGAMYSPVVSNILVDVMHSYKNEKRAANYVKIAHKDQKVDAPTNDQVKEYHQQHKDKFMAPEYRAFDFVKLSPTEASEKITLTPEDLKKEYDARVAEYTRPEKRDAVEYVVKDAATGRDVKAMLAQSKKPEEITEKLGKDKVSRREWGLTNVADIPAELKDSVLGMQVNDISEPLETKEGFHVIQIKKIELGGVDSFETVQESLAKKIKIERATNDVIEKTNKIDSDISDGKSLKDIAASYGLTLQSVALVDAQGKAKDAGAEDKPLIDDMDMIQGVFASTPRETASIRENKKGEYFSVYVTEQVPEALKSVDQVHDQIVVAWTADRQKEAAKKKATEILADVKKGGAFQDVITKAGLTKITTPVFTRDGQGLENAFPSALVKALFKDDKASEMGLQGDAYIVAEVASVVPAATMEAKDRDAMVKTLEGELKSDVSASFMNGLKSRYHAKIKLAAEPADKLADLDRDGDAL